MLSENTQKAELGICCNTICVKKWKNIFISASVCIKYLWKDTQKTDHLKFLQGEEVGGWGWREGDR